MKAIIAIFIALSITLFAATETELERAYAKEFAYLKAQKTMLTQRLQTIKESQNKNLSQIKTELSALQNIVLQKNAQSEKLSDDLFRAHQNSQLITDDTALIESVMMQSTSALKPYGIDVEVNPDNYQDALANIFENTNTLISRLSTLRSESGKFYVADGSEKEGTIIHVGNIANFGISPDASGALVPAGSGKFKVYNAPEATATASALLKNDLSKPLNIFIYENDAKEIDDVLEKTTFDIINSGGIIGWVIVVLGLVGLLLAILRSVFLISASSTAENLAKSTLTKLLEGNVESALEYLKDKKGSTARVLKATLRNLDRDREHIEDIVAESILHESGRLDSYGSAILVIAAVAPLLGLLGTVTGMIATFDIITEFGTGDPKLLSGGISIALVTTELGLIVAIPVLMVGNLLSGWAERVKDHMEHSALHLINEYNKQR
ncbi:MotA/TolQ/ExbB proton channel family protein [bacterium]|nr:MotA/TolQ/ExbB proton channel family protein [bacterium]MBU1995004.1 MotA/TolQ/ExbB proton channel family protein [bacterium]